MKRALARSYARLAWHHVNVGTWDDFLRLTKMERFLLMDETDELIERHNEQVTAPPEPD